MKIAVSASGEGLDAQVDLRFGRCRYFVFVDSDSMDYEAVANESAASMGGGKRPLSQAKPMSLVRAHMGLGCRPRGRARGS